MDEHLLYMPVRELGAKLRSRTLSPVALAELMGRPLILLPISLGLSCP